MDQHVPSVDLRAQPPPDPWGVSVVEEAIEALTDAWRDENLHRPAFDYPGLPDIEGDAWADFCVLAVSVIGCLWPPEGEDPWSVALEGERLDDAPAVFACFTRVGEKAWDPRWYATWDREDAVSFFDGWGTLQLVHERGERLWAVAQAMLERWQGSARRLLEEAEWGAPEVAELLAVTVPGYQDRQVTELGELRFDKLAHLCVTMMGARSPRPISRLDTFPVYPDYMLPRVLRHHGVLVYEPDLARAVDSRQLIAPGSPWELGIRWGTVHAAERLRLALAAAGNRVTTPQLDYHLWWSAVLGPDADAMGEHHRTITLRY